MGISSRDFLNNWFQNIVRSRQEDSQHDERTGGNVTKPHIGEACSVEIIGNGFRGRTRTASRENEHNIENLEEFHSPDDHCYEQDGLDQRQGKHTEYLKILRTETNRSIDLAFPDRCQPRHEYQEHERRPLPDISYHDRNETERRVGHPVENDLPAEQETQHLIDRAVLDKKHEEVVSRYEGNYHHRQEHDRYTYLLSPEVLYKEQSVDEAEAAFDQDTYGGYEDSADD